MTRIPAIVLVLVIGAFPVNAGIADLLSDAGMAGLGVRFTLRDLLEQERNYSGTLPGNEALKIALQVILFDDVNAASPLLNLNESRTDLINALNRPSAELYLVRSNEKNDDLRPQLGELVSKNWIFCLYLPEVSDHLYWAVIDRRGVSDPYVYGFN